MRGVDNGKNARRQAAERPANKLPHSRGIEQREQQYEDSKHATSILRRVQRAGRCAQAIETHREARECACIGRLSLDNAMR